MNVEVPRTGKAQRTREALVDATCVELAASGGFTAGAVAERAGTSPATFYAYFSSKDEALGAAFARVLDRLVEWVEGELTIERLLLRGLEGFCRDFADGAVDFFTRESLVFRYALARLPESRELRASYREHEDAVSRHLVRFVGLGQSAGKIGAGDPETIARAMLVLTQGLNNPLVLGRGRDDRVMVALADALRSMLQPRGAEGQGG